MKTTEQKQNAARIIWHSSEPININNGLPIFEYFKLRGLCDVNLPSSLRIHPNLKAFRDGKFAGYFPTLIAVVTDHEQNVIGVHRTYLMKDGTKADLGSETKKIQGVAAGGCVKLHDDDPTMVGVAEGIETALSIAAATGLPMLAPATGSVMPTMPISQTAGIIHVFADLDENGAGAQYAIKLAARLHSEGKTVFIHMPTVALLDGKKSGDWNDVLTITGKGPIKESFENPIAWAPANTDKTDWPQRLKLPSKLPPVPTLPSVLVPSSLKPWLLDEAARLQVSLELVTTAAIVVMASLIGRRCGIYPKQQDNWLIVPNLWGGIVSPASTLKTPAMNAAIGPLRFLESKAQKEFQRNSAEHNDLKDHCDFKIATIKERVKKQTRSQAQDEETVRADQSEMKKLKVDLENQAPKRRRYMLNDATVEKLGELLRDNSAGLFLFRDELYGFLQSLEKQGHEGARAFYLEAWTGLGCFTVDRIGRGTIDIPAICVSIFGGIQPEKLNQYFSATLEHGSGDDGFLSRFQLLVYPDKPPTYKYTDAEPNAAAYEAAKATAERLANLDYKKLAPETDAKHDLPALRFSPEAQPIFADWLETFMCGLLKMEEDSAFISHLSKYPSLVPSLALTFFLIEHCKDNIIPKQIPKAFLEDAIQWASFLEQHARRIYGAILYADVHAAHALAKKIAQGKLVDGATVRDIYRNEWAGLRSRELVQAGLAHLKKLNWIKVIELSAGSKGGAPSEIIKLHPDLIKAATRG